MKVDVALKGFDKLEKDLRKIADKAVPHALRSGLNDMAFTGRGFWQQEIRRRLTTRNILHSPTPTTLAFPKSSFRAAHYGLTPYLTVPFTKSAIRTITRGPKLDQVISEQTLRALLAQNEIDGWPAMALPHSLASYR